MKDTFINIIKKYNTSILSTLNVSDFTTLANNINNDSDSDLDSDSDSDSYSVSDSDSDSDSENNSDINLNYLNNNLNNDLDNELTYEITTYEDFLLSSTINKIIITNKKLKIGYIKFEGYCRSWYEINNDETLFGWLENNTNKYSLYIDKNTKKIYRYTVGLNNFCKIIDIEYNFNKIINDICKKCYSTSFELYNLEYNEYFLCNESTYCILNTINLIITNYDNKINDKIITSSSSHCFYFNNFKNINEYIINNILNSLIKDNNVLKKYKKLCYNIIVEQKEEIIFYDSTCDWYYLSTFLNDLLYAINPNIKYTWNTYNTHKNNINKIMKQKPRVIFINAGFNLSKNQINKIIHEVSNLGIKNIVIQDKCKKSIYNFKLYIEYLNNNKDIIFNIAHDKKEMEQYFESINENNYDSIFYRKIFLFNNFLKWCCVL